MDINLKWTPGGGLVTSQRILQIAKVNGSVPALTTGFLPANDLDAAISEADFTGDNYVIYRFRVKSICDAGTMDNTNGVIEAICLPCLESGITITPGQTTIAVSIVLPNPTPVAGGSTIANYSDIDGIVFELYDAAGTTLLKGPTTVLRSGNPYKCDYTFTGLVSQTDYIMKYRFIVTINGLQSIIPSTESGANCVSDTITTTI